MSKEGYSPTSGMQSAARRAIRLKEQGKAKGAGTAVGWTRAGQLSRGETLSLSTVKRMYSYFSRHEVDKQGKDWDNAESPSNGKIMWLAWGGDAGFSWSRKIVNREKNMKKSVELNEMVEEIKDMFDDVVNPITKAIEIEVEEEDDMEDTEGCDCEGCMECKANGGCTQKMCSGHKNVKKAEELSDEDISKSYESDNEDEDKWDNMEKACWSGYKQEGMKDKNGRKVPNCVPVKKSIFGTEGPQTLIPRNN
jgi:energy-converting hydrogenase A subunit M